MICIKRKAFIRPVFEKVDESALANHLLSCNQQQLRNARASQTSVDECARLIDCKPSVCFDHQLFALAVKLPRKRLAGFRVAEFQTPVRSASQLLRLRRTPPAGEV